MAESNKIPMTESDSLRDVAMPVYDDVDELEELAPIAESATQGVERRHRPEELGRGSMGEDVDHSMDQTLEGRIVAALRTVYDPEIPVDIYELGLIYDIDVAPDFFVIVRMTLTTPNCPEAGRLPGEVEEKVRDVEGVADCRVEIVWEPPWNPSYMSEAAKLELGMF